MMVIVSQTAKSVKVFFECSCSLSSVNFVSKCSDTFLLIVICLSLLLVLR